MEFLKMNENMTSEEMLEVLEQNRKTASDMRAFISQGNKILNINSTESLVSVKSKDNEPVVIEKKFSSDPSINMDEVNYYLGIVKNYETDGDMALELSLILPGDKPLLYRVAAELLREEKEAHEFVLEYAKETGATGDEIFDLSSEARVLCEKRKAVLSTLGIKQDVKGVAYVKKQGDN